LTIDIHKDEWEYHDIIKDQEHEEHVGEEQEHEEEIHKESHQIFEEEQDLPYEYIKEDRDEAYHVQDKVHEEDPIRENILPHEDENPISLGYSQNYKYGELYCYDVENIEFEEKPSINDEFEKVLVHPLNRDEVIQDSISHSHEYKRVVHCSPFQFFDLCATFFDDLESEEFLEKPLDLVNFSFDEEHDDHKIENIDYLLHIERNKCDMSCFFLWGSHL